MKAIKNILFAGVAAAAIVSANAENIYISGSTAFRKVANQQIAAFAEANGGGIRLTDTGGASPVGATDIVWSYTNSSGNTNFIVAHWNGSEVGIQNASCATNQPTLAVAFVDPSQNTLTASPVAFATGVATNSGTVGLLTASKVTINAFSHIAFADTVQGSSLFHGTYRGKTYSNLLPNDNSQRIGAVTFAWVSGATNLPISNITSQNARVLLANGYASQALFTGSSADKTNTIFVTGRNIDSGTRLTTLGETGFGTANPVKQYKAVSSTQLQLFPVESINGVTSTTAGNSGYSSGSGSSSSGLIYNIKNNAATLADGAALTVDNTGTGTYSAWTKTGKNYLVGYAGTGDAGWSSTSSLLLLAYNGVTPSINAVIQGSYTYWGYENMYQGVSIAGDTDAIAVYNGVKSNITSQPTSNLQNAGVALSEMASTVGRTGDYSTVTQNY